MPNIGLIAKSKTIDYSNEPVSDFWLKKNGASLSKKAEAREQIITLLNSVSNGVICLQSEALVEGKIAEAVFNTAERDNRVYVMTNDYDPVMQTLQGCLVRYGVKNSVKNIGSFILVNPNTGDARGLLYTGAFTEGALSENILFDLDSEQTNVLFRHFCYHFWNTAKNERIKGQQRESKESPIDIFPCVGNFCDTEYVKKEIEALRENATVLTGSVADNVFLNFAALKNSSVISSFSGNNAALVSSVKKSGNTILACKHGVFINIISGGNGDTWIIPKSIVAASDIFYALKANAAQTLQINALLSEYKNCTDYEFIDSEKRGNLSGKTIVSNGNEREIKARSQKNLGDNNTGEPLLPLDQLENAEPQFSDDGAVQTEYLWRNIPFYLPQNASKHKLYGQWEGETKKIVGKLDAILADIENAKKKEASLSKRIFRFFLGKKTGFEHQKGEMEGLKNETFSYLEKDLLEEKIRRINAIQQDVGKNVADIDEEDRIAKIEDAIEQLEGEIKVEEAKLAEEDKKLADKKAEISKKRKEIHDAYIEQRKILLEESIEKLREKTKEQEKLLEDKKQTLANLEVVNGQKEQE